MAIRLAISESTSMVVALRQARDSRGRDAAAPTPVKADPIVTLVSTILQMEAAARAMETT